MLIDRLKLNIFYTLYAVLVDSWAVLFRFYMEPGGRVSFKAFYR